MKLATVLCSIFVFKTSLLISYSEITLKPEFAACMKNDSHFNSAGKDHQIWDIVIQNYNHWRQKKASSKEIKIPKIIHHIWVGPKALSKENKTYIQTWKSKHPDWRFILWTDKEIENLKLINKKAYDASTNYGQKSDIARYEILYRFGGLYVDTDFECLKAFDDLHHTCEFYTGTSFGGEYFGLFNGLIGARAHHPILKKVIDQLLLNFTDSFLQINKTNFSDILEHTGPIFFQKIVADYLKTTKNEEILILPLSFLYPWPFWYRNQDFKSRRKWITPESLAIHHWHISWNNGKLGDQ